MSIPSNLFQIPGFKPLPDGGQINGQSYELPDPNERSGASSRGSHRLGLALRCGVAWTQRHHQVYGITPEPIPGAVPEPPLRMIYGTWYHDLTALYTLDRIEGVERSDQDYYLEAVKTNPALHSDLPFVTFQQTREPIYDRLATFTPDFTLIETELAATVGELYGLGPYGPTGNGGLLSEVVTSRIDRVDFKQVGNQWFATVHDYKTKTPSGQEGRLWAQKKSEHDNFQAALNQALLRVRFPGVQTSFHHVRVALKEPWPWDIVPLYVTPKLIERIGLTCHLGVRYEHMYLNGSIPPETMDGFARGACFGGYGGYACDYVNDCLKGSQATAPGRLFVLP